MRRLITLTTDFGTRDTYVASMKGIILSRCGDAQIVDLTHEIPPQDIFEGALFIAEASTWYPPETVHCVVVDPGVGTSRLPIAARARDQYFVCPDNGLLTFVERDSPVEDARIVENKRFTLDSISETFHGRDIFAPAAAALASGVAIADAGAKLDSLTSLDVPEPRCDAEGRVDGVVMHVDRFGNVITNIHRSCVPKDHAIAIRFGGGTIDSVSYTYGDVAVGVCLALFGSSGYLEIAVRLGNASERFNLRRGSHVEVRF